LAFARLSRIVVRPKPSSPNGAGLARTTSAFIGWLWLNMFAAMLNGFYLRLSGGSPHET